MLPDVLPSLFCALHDLPNPYQVLLLDAALIAFAYVSDFALSWSSITNPHLTTQARELQEIQEKNTRLEGEMRTQLAAGEVDEVRRASPTT